MCPLALPEGAERGSGCANGLASIDGDRFAAASASKNRAGRPQRSAGAEKTSVSTR